MRKTPDERHFVTAYRTKTTVVTLLLLASSSFVTSVWAQSTTERGGVLLRFGLGLGVETKSNSTLSLADPGTTTEAFADLSLGLSSETRTQSLSFDLAGRLRGVNAPDSLALDQGFVNPSAVLKYNLTGARSKLNFSANISESDLSDRNSFIDDTGNFNIIAGNATRRSSAVNARFEWNNDARVRYGTSVSYTDTSYRGGTAIGVGGTALNNTQRLTLGFDATLDLTTAAQLKVALDYSTLSTDAVANNKDTWTLDNTLTLNRPAGDVVFNFGVTNTEDGTRLSASAGRSYLLSRVTVFGKAGISEQVSGGITPTGALFVVYPLPRGGLSLGLSRDVSSLNEQNQEHANAQIDFSYKQALSRLSDISLDVSVGKTTVSNSNQSFSDGSSSITYSRRLTKSWDIDAGLRHRYSNYGDDGSARSNEIFMNLNRSFVTRF